MFLALNKDYKSTYEIWQHLLVTHEGTQVKRAKIDLLRSQYENFKMHENESIVDMITKLTKITNDLSSLGDEIKMIKRSGRSFVHFHRLGKSKPLH